MVPMIRKELQQRMRERRAWVVPTLYLLALASVVVIAYFETADVRGGNRDVQGAEVGRTIFLSVTYAQMAVLLLLAPAFSAGGITIEKEQRTMAGLLTSLLEPKDIWWGKFVSSFLFLFVLQVSALPILSLSFVFGGVSPLEVLLVSAITLLVLAVMCSIGLWCSSFFRKSVHATAASYGFIIALSVVTVVSYALIQSLVRETPGGFEAQPFSAVFPLLLNPFFPLIGVLETEMHAHFYWGASLLFFSAAGCLAAAGAVRNITRSGEQV